MRKFLVYKDIVGTIRFVNTGDECPITYLKWGKKLPSILVKAGAPAPYSPVFALINCK
ncbi:hypothetical protein HWA94_gp33 [Pseudomonas phage ZC08]|uniref:Uncharacterized protein n=1 Tax=Pseudomonas phage ZC08 TaxID=1622116 RepID=A0A1L2C9F2_9CAUD|nr:hypothetical protein HWA94_gp33 [Pseudomonas phage ZC08]AMD43523.1 hypothetical protein ZC08_033 [Pseudomonas phage ZC08]